jgi:hypothetical protein
MSIYVDRIEFPFFSAYNRVEFLLFSLNENYFLLNYYGLAVYYCGVLIGN